MFLWSHHVYYHLLSDLNMHIVYKYVQHVCLFLGKQELHRRYEGTPESTKTKALQTVIDMKVRT